MLQILLKANKTNYLNEYRAHYYTYALSAHKIISMHLNLSLYHFYFLLLYFPRVSEMFPDIHSMPS